MKRKENALNESNDLRGMLKTCESSAEVVLIPNEKYGSNSPLV